MSEVITATFHFLGSLIEYSAAAAVPCTKAICMMQAHPGMFGNTSMQPYALSEILHFYSFIIQGIHEPAAVVHKYLDF